MDIETDNGAGTAPTNIHSMSDADFDKLDPSQFDYTSSEDEQNLEDTGDADEEVDVNDVDLDGDVDESDEADSTTEESDENTADSDESDSDQSSDDSDTADSDTENDASDSDDSDESDADGTDEPDAQVVDYKAVHDVVMGKFRANGRDMQVKTPEEALRLMQMGANFNKKMTELKPLRQTVKALTNAGIKTPEQLNFLLDLHNKDPKAINKLVKDAGIDPMDMDTSKESEYQPDSQSRVSNAEVTLDQVLDSIEGSESGQRTLKIIGSDWDAQSKQVLFKNPEIIEGIKDNIERGVFDVIDTEVNKQRALGRLTGVSDIQAYHDVGVTLQQSGALDQFGTSTTESKKTPADKQAPAAKKTVTPSGSKKDEAARNKRRKAASSSAGKGKGKKAEVAVDYLSMSDEEFDRLHNANQQ